MVDVETLQKYVGKKNVREAAALTAGSSWNDLKKLPLKNPGIALILSIFLGMLGIDRLYQGGLKMFGCKLAMVILTFGTWWLADIYYNRHTIEESNMEKLLSAAS